MGTLRKRSISKLIVPGRDTHKTVEMALCSQCLCPNIWIMKSYPHPIWWYKRAAPLGGDPMRKELTMSNQCHYKRGPPEMPTHCLALWRHIKMIANLNRKAAAVETHICDLGMPGSRTVRKRSLLFQSHPEVAFVTAARTEQGSRKDTGTFWRE